MKFVSASSSASDVALALAQVHADLSARIDASPNVLFVFSSPHHLPHCRKLGAWLEGRYPGSHVLGCVAPGVLGAGAGPALSVMAGILPGVERFTLRVSDMRVERRLPSLEHVPVGARSWVVFADPRTTDTEAVLRQLDQRFGGTSVGCLATDITAPEHTAMFLDDQMFTDGAVALGLSGAVSLDTLLVPGCRPIGEPLIVMAVESNRIRSFDRGPAAKVVRELVELLDESERQQLSTSLCLGMQLSRDPSVAGTPGFVMRSLLGVDGAGVAVAAAPKRLQIVQFHLRDEAHFQRELRGALERRRESGVELAGMLSFVSTGLPLSPSAEHAELSGTGRTGCFCNGEIAPLEGHTRLHGLTGAVAVFSAGGRPG